MCPESLLSSRVMSVWTREIASRMVFRVVGSGAGSAVVV